MTRFQYQNATTPPAPTLAKSTGAATTEAVAGDYWVFLFSRSWAGITAFSLGAQIAIAAGEQLEVTVPSTVRAAGTYVWEVGIVLSPTSNPQDGAISATYPGFDAAGVETALPAVVILSTDDHFALQASASSPAQLPAAPLHGMLRNVELDGEGDPLGQIWTYNQYLQPTPGWEPARVQTFNPYVQSTFDEGGCDREVALIEERANLLIPEYPADGTPSVRVGFFLVNPFTFNIPQGRRIAVTFDLDGEDATSKLAGLANLIPQGHVTVATGELDTADIPGAGGSLPYEGARPVLFLEKDLLPGTAYFFEVEFQFDAIAAGGNVVAGGTYGTYAQFESKRAIYAPDAGLAGDFIAPHPATRRRILPDVGLLARATPGSGRIGPYTFENVAEEIVGGLLAGTNGQQIAISHNGTCFPATSIPPTARLRAVVGTADGAGAISPWQGPYPLDGSTLLQLTLTHPQIIRADYPDAIAGEAAALNATQVRVYLRATGTTDPDYYYDLPISGEDGEVVLVGADAAEAIASLPAVTADFGLFAPPATVAASAAGTSSLSGNFDFAIAYYWDIAITSIQHQGIDEIAGGIAEVLALADSYGDSLAISAARDIPESEVQQRKIWPFDGGLLWWDGGSTEADDGRYVFVPTWKDAGAAGRLKAGYFDRGDVKGAADIATLKAQTLADGKFNGSAWQLISAGADYPPYLTYFYRTGAIANPLEPIAFNDAAAAGHFFTPELDTVVADGDPANLQGEAPLEGLRHFNKTAGRLWIWSAANKWQEVGGGGEGLGLSSARSSGRRQVFLAFLYRASFPDATPNFTFEVFLNGSATPAFTYNSAANAKDLWHNAEIVTAALAEGENLLEFRVSATAALGAGDGVEVRALRLGDLAIPVDAQTAIGRGGLYSTGDSPWTVGTAQGQLYSAFTSPAIAPGQSSSLHLFAAPAAYPNPAATGREGLARVPCSLEYKIDAETGDLAYLLINHNSSETPSTSSFQSLSGTGAAGSWTALNFDLASDRVNFLLFEFRRLAVSPTQPEQLSIRNLLVDGEPCNLALGEAGWDTGTPAWTESSGELVSPGAIAVGDLGYLHLKLVPPSGAQSQLSLSSQLSPSELNRLTLWQSQGTLRSRKGSGSAIPQLSALVAPPQSEGKRKTLVSCQILCNATVAGGQGFSLSVWAGGVEVTSIVASTSGTQTVPFSLPPGNCFLLFVLSHDGPSTATDSFEIEAIELGATVFSDFSSFLSQPFVRHSGWSESGGRLRVTPAALSTDPAPWLAIGAFVRPLNSDLDPTNVAIAGEGLLSCSVWAYLDAATGNNFYVYRDGVQIASVLGGGIPAWQQLGFSVPQKLLSVLRFEYRKSAPQGGDGDFCRIAFLTVGEKAIENPNLSDPGWLSPDGTSSSGNIWFQSSGPTTTDAIVRNFFQTPAGLGDRGRAWLEYAAQILGAEAIPQQLRLLPGTPPPILGSEIALWNRTGAPYYRSGSIDLPLLSHSEVSSESNPSSAIFSPRFEYRSSGTTYRCKFLVDGVERVEFSGEQATFFPYSVGLRRGIHTFTWIYWRLDSATGSGDTFEIRRLDFGEIEFEPNAQTLGAPGVLADSWEYDSSGDRRLRPLTSLLAGGYAFLSITVNCREKGWKGQELLNIAEAPQSSSVSCSFWRWADARAENPLRFYVDGVEQAAFSGETGWGQHNFSVRSGVHLLRWEYDKTLAPDTDGDVCKVGDLSLGQLSLPEIPDLNDRGWETDGNWFVEFGAGTDGANRYYLRVSTGLEVGRKYWLTLWVNILPGHSDLLLVQTAAQTIPPAASQLARLRLRAKASYYSDPVLRFEDGVERLLLLRDRLSAFRDRNPAEATTPISFEYRSTGATYRCKFFIDGREITEFSGDQATFFPYSVALYPGVHTFAWEYWRLDTATGSGDRFEIRRLDFGEVFFQPNASFLSTERGVWWQEWNYEEVSAQERVLVANPALGAGGRAALLVTVDVRPKFPPNRDRIARITHSQSAPTIPCSFWRWADVRAENPLRFYLDGVEQAAFSGETGWGQHNFSVRSGVHLLRWEYDKTLAPDTDGDVCKVGDLSLGSYRQYDVSDLALPGWVLPADSNWGVEFAAGHYGSDHFYFRTPATPPVGRRYWIELRVEIRHPQGECIRFADLAALKAYRASDGQRCVVTDVGGTDYRRNVEYVFTAGTTLSAEVDPIAFNDNASSGYYFTSDVDIAVSGTRPASAPFPGIRHLNSSTGDLSYWTGSAWRTVTAT